METVDGVPFRFVTAKLYGEDAERADWLADKTNLTDLVTAALRLQHANLQRFFNTTLPEHIAKRKAPLRSRFSVQVVVELSPELYREYVEASEALEQKVGESPGPEFLMALALQHGNPMQIIEEYAAIAVEKSGKTNG